MSLRWRIDGELLCGAKTKPMPDDTYIDDRLHYHMSLTGVIEPHGDESTTGLWRWREARAPYWSAPETPLSIVRTFFANLEPGATTTIKQVGAEALARRPNITMKQIYNAHGRLVRTQEIRSLGYGQYQSSNQ